MVMFRTLPIKTRLVFSGIVSIVAIVVLAALATYSLWQSELELKRQIRMTEAVELQWSATASHEAIDGKVNYALLVGAEANSTKQTHLKTSLAEDIEKLRHRLSALRALDLSPELNATVDQITPAAEKYMVSSRKLLAQAFSDPEAAMLELAEFHKQFAALEAAFVPLAKRLDAFAAAAQERAESNQTNMLYALMGVAAITIGLVLHNARKVTLTITKPIERLRSALHDVAQGDFGLKIAARMRKDDFGEIAQDIDKISERVVKTLDEQDALRAEGERVIKRLGAGLRLLSSGDFSDQITENFNEDYEPLRADFNETVDRLNDLLSQVVQSSQGIQKQSSEIRDASQELSMRTASQAATLEETAAALEQMTNSVETAAQNTKEAEEAVVAARADVEHSGRVVEGAIEAMNEIEASSSRISQIIGVIDDIAFQTNLLALNAGVEAARAGEVGRGFAVVASEVRGLAQRSSEAANEIKILISTSTKHVQDGVRQVDGAGKALSAVVRQVANISELVTGIASTSVEQANGIKEVNVGVAQLDQVTQQNATMVEDSSSAIQSMNGETEGLGQLVSQFKLMSDRRDDDMSYDVSYEAYSETQSNEAALDAEMEESMEAMAEDSAMDDAPEDLSNFA